MKEQEQWNVQDLWLGLLFLGMGAVVLFFAFAARSNDIPIFFWGAGLFAGILFSFLGINAFWKILKSR